MTTIQLPPALSRLAFAVVDVEGNGGQPPEIVEIAVLHLSTDRPATPGDVRSWLVRPPRPITRIVTAKAHGITNDDVAAAPMWPDVAMQVTHALEGRILIAHHATVERSVLANHIPELRVPAIVDTVALAKKVWPGRDSYRLDRLIDANITPPRVGEVGAGWRRHRAAYDVWATAALFVRLVAGRDWAQIRDAATIPPTHAGGSTEAQQGLW